MKSKTFLKSILVIAIICTLMLIGSATVFAGASTHYKTMVVGQTSDLTFWYDDGSVIPKSQITDIYTYNHKIDVNEDGSLTALESGNDVLVFVDYRDNCSQCAKYDWYDHWFSCYINIYDAELSAESLSLTTSGTKRLYLKLDGESVPGDYAKWTSSDKSVATVSSKGLVTAKSPGKTTITANYNGAKFKCSVTVKGPKNCKLSRTSYTLTTGISEHLLLKTASGNVVSDSNITWKSSNKSVATVSSKGYVKGVKAGTATITATYKGNAYTCKFTVKNAKLTKTSHTLTTGTTTNLDLKNASGKAIANKNITWKTSNKSVATVTSGGVVKGVKAGSATITAVYKGKSYTCKITVKNAKLTKTSVSLTEGTTHHLRLKTASDNVLSDKNITWKSSNKSVATVNSDGVIKGIKPGTANITARYKGKSYTCKVTVKSMKLSKTSATVYMGETLKLSVDGNKNKTTWSTSSGSVAKVSSSGVVTPVKPGTATITAKKNGKTFKCKITVAYPPEKGITSKKTRYITEYSDHLFEYNVKGKATIKVTGKITKINTDSFLADSLRLSIENENYIDLVEKDICKADGTVTITANVDAGTYYVYAGTDDDATVTVSITTKPAITAPAKNLGRGYTHKFKTIGVKNKGTWSSSDKSIATVSSDGAVKGVKNGSCTIYYTMKDGKKLSYKINIVDPVTLKFGGVSDTPIYNECYVEVVNNTNRTIAYTEFYIKQYNYKGNKLSGPYSYYYDDNEIKPYGSSTQYYWVDGETKSVKLSLKDVAYK